MFRSRQTSEPLAPHPVPVYAYQKVGADIFTLHGKDYLLIVDYFSKFPEYVQLASKSADCAIQHLKDIFSRHGIPETLMAIQLLRSRSITEIRRTAAPVGAGSRTSAVGQTVARTKWSSGDNSVRRAVSSVTSAARSGEVTDEIIDNLSQKATRFVKTKTEARATPTPHTTQSQSIFQFYSCGMSSLMCPHLVIFSFLFNFSNCLFSECNAISFGPVPVFPM